jgi:hypothetical protein
MGEEAKQLEISCMTAGSVKCELDPTQCPSVPVLGAQPGDNIHNSTVHDRSNGQVAIDGRWNSTL